MNINVEFITTLMQVDIINQMTYRTYVSEQEYELKPIILQKHRIVKVNNCTTAIMKDEQKMNCSVVTYELTTGILERYTVIESHQEIVKELSK